MTGTTNLQEVLSSMQVSCDGIEYGFANTLDGSQISVDEVLGTFKEGEGLTVIADTKFLNSQNLAYEGPFAKLSIEVHTSLDLVGLTAVLATKLADQGVSANVVAAYYHDHVFVQYGDRNTAIEALASLKS